MTAANAALALPGMPAGPAVPARRTRAKDSRRAQRKMLRRIADPIERDRLAARFDLAAYLPAGSTYVRCQGDWLKELRAHVESAGLREDAQANLLKVAWLICLRANWTDNTARVSWDEIAEAAELTRRSVARWIRWLRKHGWLGHIERGTVARWRTAVENALYGDQARQPVYLLCAPSTAANACQIAADDVPPAIGTDQPSPVMDDVSPLSTGTTVTPTLPEESSRKNSLHAREIRWRWTPKTREERLRAAEQIQGRCGSSVVEANDATKGGARRVVSSAIRALSTRYLAHLARDFWEAGWTVKDVLHAVDHAPDGTRHTFAVEHVHSPAAWFSYRLGLWRDTAGEPGASITAQRAQATAERAAERAARNAEVARMNAAKSPIETSPTRDLWKAARNDRLFRKTVFRNSSTRADNAALTTSGAGHE